MMNDKDIVSDLMIESILNQTTTLEIIAREQECLDELMSMEEENPRFII